MRIIFALSATIAFAFTSAADAKQLYIGGYGALAYIDSGIDLEFDDGDDAIEDVGDVEYERGEQFGVVIGGRDDQTGLRLELDVSYLQAELESVEGNRGFDVELGDDAEAFSVLFNVAWDFLKPSFLRPYLMAGIGASWIDLGTATVQSPAQILADVEDEDFSGIALALQAGAGLSIALGDHVDLFGGYRFFGTTGLESDDGAFNTQIDLRSHNIDAGARLYF